MELHVYKPQDVLPSLAHHVKHLGLATAGTPTAKKLGLHRLSTARKGVAEEKKEVIAKEARLEEAQEKIRREFANVARTVEELRKEVKRLEKVTPEKDKTIAELQSRESDEENRTV